MKVTVEAPIDSELLALAREAERLGRLAGFGGSMVGPRRDRRFRLEWVEFTCP